MNNTKGVEKTQTPEEVKVEALTYIFTAIKNSEARSLIGKFLTVVDASIADQVQREAIKSVVKQLSYEPSSLGGKMPYEWIASSLIMGYKPESSDGEFRYPIELFRGA